jgi:predicted permease
MDIGEAIKNEASPSGLGISCFTRLVVIAELAITCMLLVGSGLMIRTIWHVQTLDLGIEESSLWSARLTLPNQRYPDTENRVALFDELLSQLQNHPAVASAVLSTSLPTTTMDRRKYQLEDSPSERAQDLSSALVVAISPGFFRTFGASLLQGRDFTRSDSNSAPPVAIVSRGLADRAWPGQSAIGRRIRFHQAREHWLTVIGVAPDLQMSLLTSRQREVLFLPAFQSGPESVNLVLKPRYAASSMTSIARSEVVALDKDMPLYQVQSVAEVVEKSGLFFRLFGSLFAILGLCALLLASSGLYGMVSLSVRQRTREVGIRMALGAERGHVLSMILWQGIRRLAVGLSLGLLLAGPMSFLLRGVLLGVEPGDPLTFLIVPLVLDVTFLLACWIPARRAARTNAVVALRSD